MQGVAPKTSRRAPANMDSLGADGRPTQLPAKQKNLTPSGQVYKNYD
ncbi:MAG: hypothetical protein ACQEXQ_12360 [Bacillota bacterium]